MKTNFLKKGYIDFKLIAKYYAAGAIVNLIGYFVFLLFVFFGIEHKVSATILYVVGSFVSYFVNRKYVFDSGLSVRKGFLRLLLVLFGGYFLNVLALYVFVDGYGLNPGLIQMFAVVVVSFYFYLVNKYFVHRNV